MMDVEAARITFGERLSRAVALDLPHDDQVLRPGSPASVLMLFGSQTDGTFHLLFVRRTESVDKHKGQIAFPGGRAEPSDADCLATALRETREEVGIPETEIRVFGKLPDLWTLTGYLVTPVVGMLRRPIEEISLVAHPDEVAEPFWLPVTAFLQPANYRREFFLAGELRCATDVYLVSNRRIWGLTGSILKNMLARLSALQ